VTYLLKTLRSYARLSIVATFVLASACDQPAGPEPITQYDILFVSSANGSEGQDIYRMSSDGTGRENLTKLSSVAFPTFELAVNYRSMALAPDGRTVAFETNRDGCPGVWGMNIDGTAIRKLSIGAFNATRCNYFALWSPDGSKIAFTTSREGRYSVYVMNADGSNPHNVSSQVDQDGFNWPSGWSPDGRVVFQHPVAATFQTYFVKPDGTDLKLLFGRNGDHQPEWSRDGSKVAFIRDTENGSGLFVMNADGTNVRPLLSQPGQVVSWQDGFQNDYNRWSSDGRRIVFVVRVNAQNELHAIDVDGTNHVVLTSYPAEFNGWAPDGRVTFSSNVSGSYDLYLINADGTGRVNLTSTSTSDEMRALWVKR